MVPSDTTTPARKSGLAESDSSVSTSSTGGRRGNVRYSCTLGLKIWIAAKFIAAGLWALGCRGTAIAVYLVPDPWFFWQIVVPASRGFGPVASRFKTLRREVWLTIDDGPDPRTTPQVLDILDRYQARATFFVIGNNIRAHPGLAREIVNRGHTLANHTASHPAKSLWHAGAKRIGTEIDGCDEALRDAGVSATPYFRPPVGIKTPFLHRELARRGLTFVAWSARGFDSMLSEARATRRILASVKPGGIILTHEGNGDLSRVRVLEGVLQGLSSTGFTTVLPKREDLIT